MDYYTRRIPASYVGRSHDLWEGKEAFLGLDIHYPRMEVVVVARVESEVEAQERGQYQLSTKSLVFADSQISKTIHSSVVAMAEAVVHGCQPTVLMRTPIHLSWMQLMGLLMMQVKLARPGKVS